MTLNYTPAVQKFMAMNVTEAAVQVYTIPLGSFAWFLVIFATLIIVYIKTQSTALTSMIGILFLLFTKIYLGVIGDTLFYTLLVLSITIILYKVWKGPV